MTSEAKSPQERLINLVIGLASTRRPVTRAQIYENFTGYQQSASQTAFERLFERDKETLRRLGIPLITRPTSTFDDEVGYLIDSGDYALPPLDLTPQQARIATLAANLWRDSAMQDAAKRGVTKLRAVGASMGGLSPSAIDIYAGETTPVFNKLLDAIEARRAVTFTYRAASTGEEAKRQVQPWWITGRRGAWYLKGHDLDREAPRLYRLDRIQGNVRFQGRPKAFEIPAADATTEAQFAFDPVQSRILVAPGRGNALRLRAEEVTPATADLEFELSSEVLEAWDGADILRIETQDLDELARAIAGLGPHALVLEPAELRDNVIALLRGAAGVKNDRN